MTAEVTSYDYIIVGAGSAGAIVAARLSENPAVNVLLVEAGPEDKSHWTKVPLGFAKVIFDSRYMWSHTTEPEPFLNGRRIALPHGKVVGGSSAVNGLQYARGFASDYDNWERLGATGWAYEAVLPYFKKNERHEGGSTPYHGGAGPVSVETARWRTPLSDAFIASAESVGIPRNDDMAASSAGGVGYIDMTSRRGRRSSTSEAYIRPNRRRKNLHLIPETLVTKVIFDGRRAKGISFIRDGVEGEAHARRDVILSLGALQTPQLLQVSGVGPQRLLREHGVPVVHDLPGVGENLIDHVHAGFSYSTDSRFTINAIMGNPLYRLLGGLDYYSGRRRGLMSIGAAPAGGFLHTRQGLPAPDVQFGFVPFLPDHDEPWKLDKARGFGIGCYQTRPTSRGSVRIKSRDFRDNPSITVNYLKEDIDRQTFLDAARIVRRIGEAAPLCRHAAVELRPGRQCQTDDEILAYARETASTAFHFCGTARIGSDGLSAVDPDLNVRGLTNLRIVDASVMPSIVSGNTNAAVMMIAEKAADSISKSIRI